MPDAAEVDGLVLLFEDTDDLGKALDALDEGVLDRLAKVGGEGQKRLGLEVLVSEEDDLVLEKRLAELPYPSRVLGQEGQVDVSNLRPDAAGDGMDG